jgi:uncharacterized delta-60 repeat protein
MSSSPLARATVRGLPLGLVCLLLAACSGTTTASPAAAECDAPSDCPDPGNACVTRLCTNHQCGTANVAEGTPAATQTDGDCRRSVCDGQGETTTVSDDADVSSSGHPCTVDACANGQLTHTPALAGAACAENGGDRCDGQGACVSCLSNDQCTGDAICASGACVPQTCNDNVKNGAETDVDCGGATCASCAVAKQCGQHADCASGLCAAGVCATTAPIITSVSAGHNRFFNVTFDAQGHIYAVGVAAPGIDSTTDYATIVARFSPAGVLDANFGDGGIVTKNLVAGANGELARAIGIQSTGKIVVAATVDRLNGADARDRDVALFRLLPSGILDTTFGADGVALLDLSTGAASGSSFLADSVWHLVIQPDDRIAFTGGQVGPSSTDTDFVMVRLLPDGAYDTSFGAGGRVLVDIDHANASARSIALLPNGDLMGCGYMDLGGVGSPVLYQVTSAGVLDTTFGSGGVFNAAVLAAQTEAYAIGLQGDKLVTTGYGRGATAESLDWLSLRFLADGTLDTTYGDAGVARIDIGGFNDNSRQLVMLPDGRILLVGGGRPTATHVDGAVALLTVDGQRDTSFTPSGVKTIDLGGGNDFLWGAQLSPSKRYVALAGIKGTAAGDVSNHDDAALVLLPIGD